MINPNFRIIDSHVHFFPERMFHAIWAFWKKYYLPFFPNWHNMYEWTNDKLVEFLEEQGIDYYTTLNYAHKKGVAERLNEWTHKFCNDNPCAIPFGAAHPDDDNMLDYVKKALTNFEFKGIKLQLMVTDFFIYDKRLEPLFELMKELGKILYLHTGTAPGINRQTLPGVKVGVEHFLKYLDKFPDNQVIVAHMGGYEYSDFFRIVEDYPNVYLDTAMVWGPGVMDLFPEEDSPEKIIGKAELISYIEENSTKILFGSDFPNIPYDYNASIDELLKLNLSKNSINNIFYDNARNLFAL